MIWKAPRSGMRIVNTSDWETEDIVRIVARIEETIEGEARLTAALTYRPGAVPVLRRRAGDATGAAVRVPPTLTILRRERPLDEQAQHFQRRYGLHLAWHHVRRRKVVPLTFELERPHRLPQSAIAALLAPVHAPVAPRQMVEQLGKLLQRLYTYWHIRRRGMLPNDAELADLALRRRMKERA